ncbi:MAG: conjugal transfer protein TrbF [Geminicoccaceae bacterium]
MTWTTGKAAAFDASSETGNPYLDAARTWDGRLGDAVIAKRNWQIATFLMLLANLALASVIAWQANRSHIEPVLVLMDGFREMPIVAHARAHSVEPSDAMVASSLARWIEDVRARPMDKVLLRQRLERAYGFLGEEARRTLDDYFQTKDPFGLPDTTAIAVEILSVVKETKSSWRVRWVERVFVRGAETDTHTYHAILSLRRGTPTTAQALIKNPLSLELTAIGWSPELES